MMVREEVAGTILEIAIGHGLVDNLLKQDLAEREALDLINRLLLAEAIDPGEAVSLILLVTTSASVAPAG